MRCLKMDNSFLDNNYGVNIGKGMDKDDVWEFITDKYPETNDDSEISIKLECGCIITYKGKANFPGRSVRCEHKNYFLKYADFPYFSWKERLTK